MTWRHDIGEALAIAKHNDRRDAITKLLLKAWDEEFIGNKTLLKNYIADSLRVSGFINGTYAKMKVRSTFSGVIAYLPLEVRVALLAHYVMSIGDCTMEDVCDAIAQPAGYGIYVNGSYKFGWPAKHDINNICDQLKKVVTMAESNGISFEDAYDCYLKIISVTWNEDGDDLTDCRDKARAFIAKRVSEQMAEAVSLVADESMANSTTDIFKSPKTAASAEPLFNDWLADSLSGLAATPATPVQHASTIDPKMIPAIDSLLLTAGAKLSIQNLLDTEVSHARLVAENNNLESKLADLQRELATAKSTTRVEMTAEANGELPSGCVVWKNAASVFQVKGAQAKAMNFDIPTWEWDGPHPWVPAIDEDYIFEPKMLVAYLDAMAGGDPVWHYGHTGCGKTTFVEQAAARMNYPVLRINCDSDIGRMDLVGRDKLTHTEGTTISEFIDGIVPQALKHGAILLVDEFDASRNETAYVLQRVTEMRGLMIAEDGGRYVPPHPMFRIAACCNSRGQGDEYGIYPAVRVQSQAVLNRFTVWLEHDYLPAEREIKLLVAKSGVHQDIATKWVGFANGIREAFKRGDVLSVASPRELVSACQRYSRYSGLMSAKDAHALALETTFLSKASGNDRAKFTEIAQRVFG